MKSVEWGEFTIGDLFDVDSWEYGKNKKYHTVLKDPTSQSISIISGITENNGVNYYTEDKLSGEEVFEAELTISTRGEYSGTVFFHNEKFALANNILVMRMPNLSKNQKMFVGGLINSLPYGGYSGYPRKETLKKDKIQLPTKNGEIDFYFMESFIAELEADHLAELQAYLSASGLNNTTLTDEEHKALDEFSGNANSLEWREYAIDDLFDIRPTKNYGLSNSVLLSTKGSTPVVSNTSINNGITAYVALEPTEKGNIITFSDTTTDEAIFYQPDDFVGYSHVQGMYKKIDEKIGKPEYLFIVTAFKSAVRGKYNYGSKFNRDNAAKERIHLPVKNGDLDLELMRTYISAIQKLVIKDVVQYANEKVAKTQQE